VTGFPKPPTRKADRALKRRADRAWVSLTRKQVMARDGGCRSCRELHLSPENFGLPVQMHELIYRSKTRGRPIEERVNTGNCIMLCPSCHRAVHAKRLSIHIATDKGADGKLLFKLW
jgi:5-methylcytosine-specific restriction endonuclease McrA